MSTVLRFTEEQLAAYNAALARRRGIGNAELVQVKRIAPKVWPKLTPLILPWPTSGNTAVRHGQFGHYVTQATKDYREAVAARCAEYMPIQGQYRLFLTLSPPDKRRRDADNAIKVLVDALVRCGYLPDDAMSYMRELHVTVEGQRGDVAVRVEVV